MSRRRTDQPFAQALPVLLRERDLSLRKLAKEIGVTDAHLSRVVRGVNYKSASGDLAGRVAVALGLPRDYFPEYREAAVVEHIKRDAAYRDKLYDGLGRK